MQLSGSFPLSVPAGITFVDPVMLDFVIFPLNLSFYAMSQSGLSTGTTDEQDFPPDLFSPPQYKQTTIENAFDLNNTITTLLASTRTS